MSGASYFEVKILANPDPTKAQDPGTQGPGPGPGFARNQGAPGTQVYLGHGSIRVSGILYPGPRCTLDWAGLVAWLVP
jgi:hypothetical protein